MDVRALKSFHQIIKHGSFNRAAQEMNYAQSTVTMQMQKLEAELGMPLLERGKEIRLTEAGKLLYEQSLSIVQQMERLQTSLEDFKCGDSGYVRIGATEPTASYRLPELLQPFMAAHPKILIHITISSTPHLCKQVFSGEIDFALCTSPGLEKELYFEPLFMEEFIVLMPPDHPLARKDTIEVEDLREHRLLITSAACPYRKKLEQIMQDQGIAALNTMEVGSMTALKHYVASGLGLALVPRIMVDPTLSGVTARTVADSLIHMTSGILYRESAYPFHASVRRLYDALKLGLGG